MEVVFKIHVVQMANLQRKQKVLYNRQMISMRVMVLKLNARKTKLMVVGSRDENANVSTDFEGATMYKKPPLIYWINQGNHGQLGYSEYIEAIMGKVKEVTVEENLKIKLVKAQFCNRAEGESLNLNVD